MVAIIRAAASRHGLDPDGWLAVGRCESGLNPSASNGPNKGLFQQNVVYWYDRVVDGRLVVGRARHYGYPGASIFDPVANANVSAAMWADGYEKHWSCRGAYRA